MDALEHAASSFGASVLDLSIPAKNFYLNRGYRVTGATTWEVDPRYPLPCASLAYKAMEKMFP